MSEKHIEMVPILTMLLPSFLFICTGNICRSPLAEAAMRVEARKRGLELDIDSAATGVWHVGEMPDVRARRVAHKHGLDIGSCIARQLCEADFVRFDHIIALDAGHLRALRRLAPESKKDKIRLLLDYVPERQGEEISDPFYGKEVDFETAWQEIALGCQHLARFTLEA